MQINPKKGKNARKKIYLHEMDTPSYNINSHFRNRAFVAIQ